MEVWAQEFDDANIQALKEALQNGEIKIASFKHNLYGTMNIMIWE